MKFSPILTLIVLILLAPAAFADTVVESGEIAATRDGKVIELDSGNKLMAGETFTFKTGSTITTEGKVLHFSSPGKATLNKDGSFKLLSGSMLVLSKDMLVVKNGKARVTVLTGIVSIKASGTTLSSACHSGAAIMLSAGKNGEGTVFSMLSTGRAGKTGQAQEPVETESLAGNGNFADHSKMFETDGEALLKRFKTMSGGKAVAAAISGGDAKGYVTRADFNGELQDGDVVETTSGKLQMAFSVGKATLLPSSLIRTVLGKEVTLVLEVGELHATAEEGIIKVKTNKLIAAVQKGTLECEVKGGFINFEQRSGRSLVFPTGGEYRNKITAMGKGADVKYEDGEVDRLESGDKPSTNSVDSFVLEAEGGLTYDDSVKAAAGDSAGGAGKETPDPPKDPEGPARGDISPH
ncbi:MAG: hypothetical protein U5N86_10290 [Planctomycetota bacterium]|nr:hypothetical protein [Planctomycetota bacterium]